MFAYNHSFKTVIQSSDCKQTPVGLLYSEKMDDVVLLNVFTKGFSASPLYVYRFVLLDSLSNTNTNRTVALSFAQVFYAKVFHIGH